MPSQQLCAHENAPTLLALAPVLLAAACQAAPTAPAQISSAPAPAFIEAACAGCHAVEPPFESPNPYAPDFEAIANREGLTDATLSSWLRDAHNYPEIMDFDLEDGQVRKWRIT